MNEFEKQEILSYPIIYWTDICGRTSKPSEVEKANNYGFDLENGDIKVKIGDHISFRYEILGVLGKGSFGQVFKVFDHKKQKMFALKIIRNKERFNVQGLVEIKLLEACLKNDHH